MIANVRVRYSNGVLTPLEPLDLEEGKEVTVSIDEAPAAEPHESLLEMFDRLRRSVPPDIWDDVPTDLAQNKKHYLYGHPKEET